MACARTAVAAPHLAVVIPTLDEAGSIAGVVSAVLAEVDARVIVADNGSRDGTAAIARRAGAEVVEVSRRGYGHACRAGADAAAGCSVVVFMDGDGSMSAADLPALVAPIVAGDADIVCGARTLDGAVMPPHQRLGNRVIALLLRRHGVRLPELCPYRAVRADLLAELGLGGSRFAWPAEMLARASQQGARITSVPIGYRERAAGRSKVGGSLRGSLAATWDIARALLRDPVRRRAP